MREMRVCVCVSSSQFINNSPQKKATQQKHTEKTPSEIKYKYDIIFILVCSNSVIVFAQCSNYSSCAPENER